MDNYGYEPEEEGQADLSGSDQEGGIPDKDMQSYKTGPDILKCNCHNCPPEGANCCKLLKILDVKVNEFAQAGVPFFITVLFAVSFELNVTLWVMWFFVRAKHVMK